MKRLLILANSDSAIFKFRSELIEELAKEFHIALGIPFGEYIKDIQNDEYEFYDIKINRHGVNPLEDFKLMLTYDKLIKTYKPDVVLEYTIKPNLYGSMVCAKYNIPFLCNITGLGTALEKNSLLQKLLIVMYKYAMRKAHTIFFQNEYGRTFFRRHRIGKEEQYVMLPGSGVNLERFCVEEYPCDDIVRFLFVARIIKEKGIEEYLYAAEKLKKEVDNVEFHICGACEQEYDNLLAKMHADNIIVYHGLVKDMRMMYKMSSCVVLPSFYPEGQSNVLLEGAATGRPLITTNHPGCREAVDDGISGYIVCPQDRNDLYSKMKTFSALSKEERENMGVEGRKKIEAQFDRKIVIDLYKNRIHNK